LPLYLEICGLETIQVDPGVNFTYSYDNHQFKNFTITKQDYSEVFASTSDNCSVTSYALSTDSSLQETSQQIGDYIFMDERGKITFDFDKLWNIPERPTVVEFHIVASTKAGVKNSKRVSLIRRQQSYNTTSNQTASTTDKELSTPNQTVI
jgi:hypothetical protein